MNIRTEISKILVKWNMPTRQVAINEIIQAFEQMVNEKEEWIEAHDNDGHRYKIPRSKLSEWREWLEIPEDDEKSWVLPLFAERIDGQQIISFKDDLLSQLK